MRPVDIRYIIYPISYTYNISEQAIQAAEMAFLKVKSRVSKEAEKR